jgi:hypothetical protein
MAHILAKVSAILTMYKNSSWCWQTQQLFKKSILFVVPKCKNRTNLVNKNGVTNNHLNDPFLHINGSLFQFESKPWLGWIIRILSAQWHNVYFFLHWLHVSSICKKEYDNSLLLILYKQLAVFLKKHCYDSFQHKLLYIFWNETAKSDPGPQFIWNQLTYSSVDGDRLKWIE